MNNRITKLWLPGLINLTATMSLLMMLRQLGLRPHIVWVGRMPVLLYVPWLIALPLFGVISARFSRRARGGLLVTFAAALFPAVVMFGLVCLGLLEMAVSQRLDKPEWLYIVVSLFNWVILPGAALLAGPLSILKNVGTEP